MTEVELTGVREAVIPIRAYKYLVSLAILQSNTELHIKTPNTPSGGGDDDDDLCMDILSIRRALDLTD